jgi:tRNA A-37 threonylcarbamoyl transferase component Bud32
MSDIAGIVGATTRIGLHIPETLSSCEPLQVLRDPGRLLVLPEGRASLGCDPGSIAYIAGVAGAAGRGLECSYASPLSSSLICSYGGSRFIVKEYTRMQIKWIPASLASAMMYKYRVSPKSRMAAEYRNLRVLRKVVRTPRIYGVCGTYYSTKMVREYVEGNPVASSSSIDDWRLAGETLALLHDNDIAVGDPNPGNFIVTGEREVALIDVEQAARFDPRKGLWDIIVFTLYSLVMGVDESLVAGAIREYFGSTAKRNAILKEAEKEAVWAAISLLPSIGLKARQLIMSQALEYR